MNKPIFVDVAFSYPNVQEHIQKIKNNYKIRYEDVNCAVVDVLRATTTIISSLHNECFEVYPVTSKDAAKLKEKTLKKMNIKKKIILAGEKNGRPLKDFHLGNSPLNFKSEIVKNNILIISTSNGTKAINAVKDQENVILFSLANLSAAASSIIKSITENKNLLIVCSGREGKYCEEDSIASGLFIQKIINLLNKKEYLLSDSAKASIHVANFYKDNILYAFQNCSWGKHLIQLGLKKDIEFCSKIDWSNVVPKYKNGKIILF